MEGRECLRYPLLVFVDGHFEISARQRDTVR